MQQLSLQTVLEDVQSIVLGVFYGFHTLDLVKLAHGCHCGGFPRHGAEYDRLKLE